MIGGTVRRQRMVSDNFFGFNQKEKKILRYKKVNKEGRRLWNIDFRGIRLDGAVFSPSISKYGGSLPAFKSPEILQKVIDKYFKSCEHPLFSKNGNPIIDKYGNQVLGQTVPYTVSGLALALGVNTSTLVRYSSGQFDFEDFGGKEYGNILKEAIQKVENYAERRLFDKEGSAGARFLLDSSFGRITQKEATEIAEKKFNAFMKEKEFEMKEKLLNTDDSDNEIEIKIVRKK